MDHVGLVLGLEMSRQSRSCRDWHHLLEVCGLFGALLADQDGLYDPSDPDDRLVLGLKGNSRKWSYILSEVAPNAASSTRAAAASCSPTRRSATSRRRPAAWRWTPTSRSGGSSS